MNDAFISYSRKDTDFARRLEKALRAYRPPKDLAVAQRPIAVFRDEGDLTGVEYFASIERFLADSTRLVVICSPNSRASTYVNDEIERFVRLRGAENVVPILLAGIPNNEARTPDDADQAFPPALCKALAMPLAVPYRGFDGHKDRVDRGSFADAWYLLLANLYGVSRAELEQREKRRRARRLRIIAGIVTGVIGLLAAALVVSIFSWRQAVEQRNIAVEQSRISLSRQLSANSAQYSAADPRLASLLAVEAYATKTTPEARRALYGAMQLVVPTTLLQSKQALEATAFSPDGSLLAAAGKDSLIYLYDVHSRRPVGQPWQGGHKDGAGRASTVKGIAFSPDGATLASVGDDGTLILWDVRSGKPIGEPLRVSSLGAAYSVAFSPDGKIIATGSIDKVVVLWDAVQRTEIRRLEGHDFAVSALAFAPNGEILAASSGNDVMLWNLSTGQLALPPLKGHTSLVWSLAFSADGYHLASGSEDYTIRLWHAPSGELEGEPVTGHGSWVKALAYSSDGRVLISGSNDQTIRLWDLETRRRPIGTPLEGHSLWVNSIALDRSGNLLASAGADGALILWSLALDGVRFAVDLVAPGIDRNRTFSRNGRYVSLFEYGKGVDLWDVEQRKVVLQATHVDESSSILALSNDGRLQVTRGPEGPVLSDLRQDKIHCAPKGDFENGGGHTAEFSPDGTLLAVSAGENSYGVWHTADCTPLELPAVKHDKTVWHIAFTPDGRQVVTGSFTPSLHVQDLTSGAERVMKANSDIGLFAVSPDSRIIAFSTEEGIELRDLQSDAVAGATLAHQKGAVREMGLRELVFSADGKMLASGGDSGKILLWDLSTGRPLGPPIDPGQGQLRHLIFTADGKHLLTSGTDRAIKLLDMDADAWMRQVCRVAQSDLSAEEWRRFVGAGSQVSRCLETAP